ncbi:hypothetical protein GJ496_010124 [Pomphorhynchus laevis]|nr:hypothetical protein GJ496_010124 [Pomphorhynchus laevis]
MSNPSYENDDPQTFRFFANRFDAYVLDSLLNIEAMLLDYNQRDQAELPTRLRDVGLRRTTDHSASAFVASFARVAFVKDLPCSHFSDFDSSFADLLLTSKVPASDAEILSQSRLSSIADNTTFKNLKIKLNQFDRARCLSVTQSHASAWLHVNPNEASRTAFPSPQFCSLILCG